MVAAVEDVVKLRDRVRTFDTDWHDAASKELLSHVG